MNFLSRKTSKTFGFAQIPILIGLAIMIIALPVSVRLVQERQDVRKQAAGGSSAPACNAGDEGRTYGECCGCRMTKEVRECTKPDGTKYWLTGSCSIPNDTCQGSEWCPQESGGSEEPTPKPNCPNNKGQRLSDCVRVECDGKNWMKIEEWCNNDGYKYNKTGASTGVSCDEPNPGCSSPKPQELSPTPGAGGVTCAGGKKPGEYACLDADHCKLCQSNGLYVDSTSCDCPPNCRPERCSTSSPTVTPNPESGENLTPSPSVCEGVCRLGNCFSGEKTDCVAGSCPGCGQYEVCCVPGPTATPKPTSTPTTVGGLYCDGNALMVRTNFGSRKMEDCLYGCENGACKPGPTATPKPTSTPTTVGGLYCDGNALMVRTNFGSRKMEDCLYGCENGACKPKPTPTSAPTRSECSCIDGTYQGSSCESWMLGRSCVPTSTPTPKRICVYKEGKTYSEGQSLCSADNDKLVLTCTGGELIPKPCSEGEKCVDGQCKVVEEAKEESCSSLGGTCRFNYFGLGYEGAVCQSDETFSSKGTCGPGQDCCIRAKGCGNYDHLETICQGRDGYQMCVNGEWTEVKSCPGGKVCQYDKETGAQCVSSLPEEGKESCSAEGGECRNKYIGFPPGCFSDEVERGGYDCGFAEVCCFEADQCQNPEGNNRDIICENNIAKICLEGEWQDVKDCNKDNKVCQEGVGCVVEEAQEITKSGCSFGDEIISVGGKRCADNRPQVCLEVPASGLFDGKVNYDWRNLPECNRDEVCEEGECLKLEDFGEPVDCESVDGECLYYIGSLWPSNRILFPEGLCEEAEKCYIPVSGCSMKGQSFDHGNITCSEGIVKICNNGNWERNSPILWKDSLETSLSHGFYFSSDDACVYCDQEDRVVFGNHLNCEAFEICQNSIGEKAVEINGRCYNCPPPYFKEIDSRLCEAKSVCRDYSDHRFVTGPDNNCYECNVPELEEGENKDVFSPDPGNCDRIIENPEIFTVFCEEYATPVKLQEGGTCWANAVTGAMEAKYKSQTGETVNLSEGFLCAACSECSPAGESGCDGGWPDIALNWISKNGIVEESCNDSKCPRVNNFLDNSLECQKKYFAYSPESNFGYYQVAYDDRGIANLNKIRKLLRDYGPIPVTIDVLDSGHAVVLCGYNDFERKFIWKNSWGSSWLYSGYGKTAYEGPYDTYAWLDQFKVGDKIGNVKIRAFHDVIDNVILKTF